jgi:zinc protease
MLRKLGFMVVGISLLLAIYGFSKPANVHEYHLDNGLKIVVKVDRRAPVVVSQIWYKVGSADEPKGLGGISHVLEHMMFKGTKKYPPGEFSRIIAANGGRDNAFTSRDYTAYFQTLEKSRLEISLQMEADRMRNLTLPEAEFNKEIKVVMEERRLRTDDNPQALTYEQFYATAFKQGPYHHPIIGSMNDLNNISVNNLRDWYQRYYVPNNATLVVVGDVQPGKVYQMAKKHFGPIPARKVRANGIERVDGQKRLRRIDTHMQAQLPYLTMGYRVPVLAGAKHDWEPYALEVLAAILDGGPSARMPGQLVRRDGLAAGIGVSYNLVARYNDLFVIQAIPGAGVAVTDLEKAIRQMLTRMKQEAVSEDELAIVKARVMANKVYEEDSIFYQAMEMGILETVGLGWQRADDYTRRIQAVTPQQVMAVAKKYLRDDRLTVAILHPQASKEAR